MRLSSTARGMLWAALAGVLFSTLNSILRNITLNLDVYESLFLRYSFGLLVMLPWFFRNPDAFVPKDVKGQFWRGAVHTGGLMFWFTALPHITLADMTALSFTGPIFIMLGAAWFLVQYLHVEEGHSDHAHGGVDLPREYFELFPVRMVKSIAKPQPWIERPGVANRPLCSAPRTCSS